MSKIMIYNAQHEIARQNAKDTALAEHLKETIEAVHATRFIAERLETYLMGRLKKVG